MAPSLPGGFVAPVVRALQRDVDGDAVAVGGDARRAGDDAAVVGAGRRDEIDVEAAGSASSSALTASRALRRAVDALNGRRCFVRFGSQATVSGSSRPRPCGSRRTPCRRTPRCARVPDRCPWRAASRRRRGRAWRTCRRCRDARAIPRTACRPCRRRAACGCRPARRALRRRCARDDRDRPRAAVPVLSRQLGSRGQHETADAIAVPQQRESDGARAGASLSYFSYEAGG